MNFVSLNVSLDFVSENIEILGKRNSLFLSGPVIKGWFSQAHKHNINITIENTPDISVSKSRNIRRTNPLTCLMLFSLAHKHKHKKNEHVCFSCAYAYAYAEVRTA